MYIAALITSIAIDLLDLSRGFDKFTEREATNVCTACNEFQVLVCLREILLYINLLGDISFIPCCILEQSTAFVYTMFVLIFIRFLILIGT